VNYLITDCKFEIIGNTIAVGSGFVKVNLIEDADAMKKKALKGDAQWQN
jgi:hypothetical protein